MIRHGKKVNKTARYTEDDVKRLLETSMMSSIDRIAKAIHEIHEMAFRDYIQEHAPRINLKTAILDYNEMVIKYTNDYGEQKFSLTQLQKYNRDIDEEQR